MGSTGSYSQGAEASNAGVPPFRFELNADDLAEGNPDAYWYDQAEPIQWHLLQHARSSYREAHRSSDMFDTLSSVLQQLAVMDMPSVQEAVEPPPNVERDAINPDASEMDVAFDPPAIEMAPAAAEPPSTEKDSVAEMETSSHPPEGTEASSDPPEVEMVALDPPVVRAEDPDYNIAVVEGTESLAAEVAPSAEHSIVPHQIFLPPTILLGDINVDDHQNYNEGVGFYKKEGSGEVAAPPTPTEQSPQTEAAYGQAATEEGSQNCTTPSPHVLKPWPAWLPQGWMIYDVERTAGATAGKVDRYYYSPRDLKRFRSRLEVLSYIKHGRIVKREGRSKRKNAGCSSSQASMMEGTPPRGMLLVPHGEPFNHISIPRRGVLKVWKKKKIYHPGIPMDRITYESGHRVLRPPSDASSTP